MKQSESLTKRNGSRRSFLKKGALGAGATAIAAGLLPGRLAAFGQAEDDGAPITKGDIAILTFLSALEQVEADLWIQYAELGGPTKSGARRPRVSPRSICSSMESQSRTGLAPDYVIALQVLDGDMPQYIADNTDDEISHHRFLNNYLQSKGAKTDRSEPVCHSAAEPSNGRAAKRETHQSEAVDRGYEVVDPIPQRCTESRLRRQLRERGAGLSQGAASGHSR